MPVLTQLYSRLHPPTQATPTVRRRMIRHLCRPCQQMMPLHLPALLLLWLRRRSQQLVSRSLYSFAVVWALLASAYLGHRRPTLPLLLQRSTPLRHQPHLWRHLLRRRSSPLLLRRQSHSRRLFRVVPIHPTAVCSRHSSLCLVFRRCCVRRTVSGSRLKWTNRRHAPMLNRLTAISSTKTPPPPWNLPHVGVILLL